MENEAVVDVSVVGEVKCCVVEEVGVELLPRVFDESNGHVAQGRRELGANPSPSDLFVGVVACPENAGVECKSDNCWDVRSVDGALGGMSGMVAADMGMVEWVAGGFGVNGECVGSALALPLLDQRMNSVDQAMLGD